MYEKLYNLYGKDKRKKGRTFKEEKMLPYLEAFLD